MRAIIEAKWKYPGNYLFHCHGIQEEGGNMGQINVGTMNHSGTGGSLSMIDEQYELQKKLQTYSAASPIPIPSNLTKNISIVPNASLQGSTIFYDPSPAKIANGTKVIWTNDDRTPHTVTSGVPTEANNLFDSGVLFSRDSFSHNFNEEGTFPYYCILHPQMIGTVIAEHGGNIAP